MTEAWDFRSRSLRNQMACKGSFRRTIPRLEENTKKNNTTDRRSGLNFNFFSPASLRFKTPVCHLIRLLPKEHVGWRGSSLPCHDSRSLLSHSGSPFQFFRKDGKCNVETAPCGKSLCLCCRIRKIVGGITVLQMASCGMTGAPLFSPH